MSKHLLVAEHGTLGPIPFNPSWIVPIKNDEDAAKWAEAIGTLDTFDVTPGDGSFEVLVAGKGPKIFGIGLDVKGVLSMSIVETPDVAGAVVAGNHIAGQ